MRPTELGEWATRAAAFAVPLACREPDAGRFGPGTVPSERARSPWAPNWTAVPGWGVGSAPAERGRSKGNERDKEKKRSVQWWCLTCGGRGTGDASHNRRGMWVRVRPIYAHLRTRCPL